MRSVKLPKPQEQGPRSWVEPLTNPVQSQKRKLAFSKTTNARCRTVGLHNPSLDKKREFKPQTIPAEWVQTNSMSARRWMPRDYANHSANKACSVTSMRLLGFRKSRTRTNSIHSKRYWAEGEEPHFSKANRYSDKRGTD